MTLVKEAQKLGIDTLVRLEKEINVGNYDSISLSSLITDAKELSPEHWEEASIYIEADSGHGYYGDRVSLDARMTIAFDKPTMQLKQEVEEAKEKKKQQANKRRAATLKRKKKTLAQKQEQREKAIDAFKKAG